METSDNRNNRLPFKKAEKAHDLDTILASVKDAASAAAGTWLPYLLSLFYFGAAAGGVTHSDLLLENSVKLPFLGVELPLFAFFIITPVLLLISHAYILLQEVILAAKVGTLNRVLCEQFPDEGTREDLRQGLPEYIFVQILAGPWAIRSGVLGLILKAIAWSTLVIGPLLLLLWIQLQFLPFHHEGITWWHRILVLVDVVLVWLLWPTVLENRSRITLRGLRHYPFFALGSLATIVFAFTVATFPGEAVDEWVGVWRLVPYSVAKRLGQSNPDSEPGSISLHDLIFRGPIDQTLLRRHGLFSDTLVLSNLALSMKTDDQVAFKKPILRGRNLRRAVFLKTDLREVDLTEAQLQGAQLNGANLPGAILDGAQLQGSKLDWAILDGANLNHARLQGAFLDHARLHGATLSEVQAQGAILHNADLRGARLDAAQLQGASLIAADLRGARLDRAQLQGAGFVTALLDGANFNEAAVWHANFDNVASPKPNVLATDLDEKEILESTLAEIKSDVTKQVPEGKRRADALRLIEGSLDPHITWHGAKLKENSDKCANQKRLAEQLKALIYSDGDDAVYTLRGLISNGRIKDSVSKFGPDLVKSILEKPPLSKGLEDQDKADLKNQASEAQEEQAKRQAGKGTGC